MISEVDVVHAHSPVLASAARLAARSLPAGRRPAVVTTEHNEWTSHRTPTRLLNGLTAPLDAHHWAVSEQVRATVWRSRREGYEVLIHGIDPDAVRPGPHVRARVRGELGVAEDEVLSLTVANLRKNKDYPNLLRAARIALDAEPSLRFAAVGQGPLADEVAALHASLGLGDRFLLLGYRRDVHDLMAAADVFTLASAHEGLPVAVMEAFANGLPVVATAVGGLPQQVSDGIQGLLVPPGRPRGAGRRARHASRGTRPARSGWAPRRCRARHGLRHPVRRAEQERVYAALADSPAAPDGALSRAGRRPCRAARHRRTHARGRGARRAWPRRTAPGPTGARAPWPGAIRSASGQVAPEQAGRHAAEAGPQRRLHARAPGRPTGR